MAYSLYEETQLDSPKSTQYYPQEYDYSSYLHYQKQSEEKVDFPSDHSTKKNKKATSINYINERKCPIYVHQYSRAQNASTYNNYSSKNPAKPPIEKLQPPKPKKVPGFPTTKSVLDQLEETYWATWKPNKETTGTMSKKTRIQDNRMNKMKAYGDVPDSIANYFSSSDYETTAVSTMEESDYERNEYETVINIHEPYEDRRNSGRLRITHTQEIQTNFDPGSVQNFEDLKEAQKDVVEVQEEKSEEKEHPTEKSSDEDPEETPNKEESKLLKHTDSFIINKKKQGEVKERFQQPKCIRLYRKPGISTSFIKGGTYPLKSCLKREPAPKGNFRLGPPGSPLFVSTSSFHRKSKK